MGRIYKLEATLSVLFTLCLIAQPAKEATYKMKQYLLNVSEPVVDYGWIRLPMETQLMRAFNAISKGSVHSVQTESIQPDPDDNRNIFILYLVKVADMRLTPYRIGRLYEKAVKNGFKVLYEAYTLYAVYDLPLKVYETNNLIFTTFPPAQNFWYAEDLCYSKGARIIYAGVIKKSHIYLLNSLNLSVFSKIWVADNVPYDSASNRSEKYCKYHSVRRNADAPCDKAGYSVVCMKPLTKCYSEIEDKCGAGGQCYVTYSKYVCKCYEGFTGKRQTCVDVDECQIGNHHTCNEYAICKNTYGSYECQCSLGLTGNGHTCARTFTMRQQFNAYSFEENITNGLKLNKTSLKMILKSKNWTETVDPLIRRSVSIVLGTKIAESIQVTQIDKRPEEDSFYATINITVTNLSITSDNIEELYGRRIHSNQQMPLPQNPHIQLLSISKVCTQKQLNTTSSNDQSFLFGDAVIGTPAYSYEKCLNTGRPEAMVDCKNVTGTPGFDESTLTQLACDATIRTIAQQTLYSSKDVTALSKQLYMMTTFNISADESVYIEYTNLLKNLSIHLVEHNITISPEAYRYLIDIANVLLQLRKTMLAGLMPTDKKSSKTSDFDILTALKVLTELVKLEPGGYISISTESIEIKVSRLLSIDNTTTAKEREHANRRYIANEHAIDTDMIVWSFGVAQTTFPVFSETRSARNTSSFGRNNFLLFIDGDLRPKHDMNEPSKIFTVVTNAELHNELKIYTKIPPDSKTILNTEISYRCAYHENNRHKWLFDRCSTKWDERTVNCTCSNVTDISVLVISKTQTIQRLLDVYEIIAIALVVFACVVTLLVLAPQKKLRVLMTVKMDIAYTSNLLLAYVTMLISAVAVISPVVCLTLSYVYHFFYICAWGWMTFHVYLIYRKHRAMSYQTLQEWCVCGVFGGIVIISSIMVGIAIILTSAAPNITEDLMPYYASRNEFMELPFQVSGKICWVYGRSVYFTLFIPSAIAFIGTTTFLLATYLQTRSKRTRSTRASFNEGVIRFILSLLLLSSMIFTVLTLHYNTEAFGFSLRLISAILYILQGILLPALLLSSPASAICCASKCLITKTDEGNHNGEIEMPTVSGLTTRSNND